MMLRTVTLVITVLAGSAFNTPKPKRLLNRPVPAFTAHTLTGQLVDASYFKGKVTLLNFMYIGCQPCMAEMPLLQRLHQEYQGRLQVVSIAPHTAQQLQGFQSRNTPEGAIRRYFKVDSIRYALVPECDKAQPHEANFFGPECSTISSKFYADTNGYPMSFLIDQQGMVRRIYEGFPMVELYKAAQEKKLRADIAQLLVGKGQQ